MQLFSVKISWRIPFENFFLPTDQSFNAHMQQFVSLPTVKSISDVKGLRKLYEKIEGSVRNLKTLNVDSSSYGNLLVPLINAKLPNELRLLISRKFDNEIWILSDMLRYLKIEIEAKERSVSLGNIRTESSEPSKDQYTTSALHASEHSQQSFKKKCVFCNFTNHPSWRCSKISNPQNKRTILKRNGLCFICFEKGHLASSCTLDYSCNKCQGKHNISICMEPNRQDDKNNRRTSNKINNSNSTNSVGTNTSTESATTNFNNSSTSSVNSVLLQTAKTTATNVNESKQLNVRIMFDSGSQRTYISNYVQEKLNLEPLRNEKLILKTFGNDNPVARIFDVVKLKLHGIKKNFVIEALVVPTICSPLTNQKIASVSQSYPHLKNLKLADPFTDETMNIDILVGTDFYHTFFTDEVIRGKSNEPVALSSHFGWILSGSFKIKGKQKNINRVHTFRLDTRTCSDYEYFNETGFEIKQAFDYLHPNDFAESSENESVYQFYKHNLNFDGKNYQVKLPFKNYTETLPDNYQLAKSRLFGLKKQLKCNTELCENYDKIIKDYLSKNIIEEVKDDETFENAHYLPHRAVIRNEKDTTKVRVVFDASAKLPGQPSLNDVLYSGPCLLPLVHDILLRFRLGEIAIVADIQQAFLQISIDMVHRNFLRFLWFEDIFSSDLIKTFRFARVMFGLTCSPFLLNATIKSHVEKYIDKETEMLLLQFLHDLYVDDTATSFDELTEAVKFFELTKTILASGGFNLRKWETNNSKLRDIINNESGVVTQTKNDESTYAQSQLGFNTQKYRKVLGINWDTGNDLLVYDFTEIINIALELELTKRNVLRISAMFYDPLGLISPITLQFRLIFKSLCTKKLSWDSPIPLHYAVKWKKLLHNLKSLNTISAKRCLFTDSLDERNTIELHGFCDSSKEAYSSVIYVREVSQSNEVHTRLYSAKCRLVPSKCLSIPRLELLACLLLSEQMKTVVDAISSRVKIDRIFCWSDSQIALWWIKQVRKSWKIWVENRVNKIRTNVPINCWRYIRTGQNPADLATRQIAPCGLNENLLWWEGPSLLKIEDSVWPEAIVISSKEEMDFDLNDVSGSIGFRDGIDLEERLIDGKCDKSVVLNSAVESGVGIGEVIDIKRFSDLERLLRVTTYVVRFLNNLKAAVNKVNRMYGELVVDELEVAEKLWVKYEQSVIISDKLKFEKLKYSLDLFYDDKNFVRSKTRMDKHLKFTFDNKNPLLLRSNSYFTNLIILRSHEKVFHNGLEATLSNIRLHYWITKGRQSVKNVLKKCFLCKLVKGKFITPAKTPSLPTFRVNCSHSFESVGVDFAGPLFVKDVYNKTENLNKCYLLLFTCATTRALHLEITQDVSTKALILAIRRFIARRGNPHLFISDNFKSFKAIEVKKFLT